MKITCEGCSKVYNIPDERIPKDKKISFPCPSCKSAIHIDIRPAHLKEGDEQPRPKKSGPSIEVERDLPSGDILKKIILNRLTELPPMPQVMFKAREIMNDPTSSFKALADILEKDQAMATRVLRLSNSAYYGLAGKVTSLQHAAVLLGYKTVGEVVAMATSSKLLGDSLEGYKLNSGDLWKHSLAVAIASRLIAAKGGHKDLENDAFSAGLIHDGGKIVLNRYILERSSAFENYMSDESKSFLDAEKEILGFDHSEIAAGMCEVWKIPKSLVSAICFHHYPAASNGNMLANIVHVADALALMSGIGAGVDGMLYKMDQRAQESLGLSEEVLSGILDETVESVEKITEQFQ
jgi:HD-like signal output (HDOD) protein